MTTAFSLEGCGGDGCMLLQSLCFVVPTPCRARFWFSEASEKDVFLKRGNKGLGIVDQKERD